MAEYLVDVTLTLTVEADDPSAIEAAVDDLLEWIPSSRLRESKVGDWSESAP